MSKDVSNLADNKLSVLYFMGCLNIPLTNEQITRFFVARNIMNYFDLQQYIIELISGELLEEIEAGNLVFLSLTAEGKNVLSFFRKRVPPRLRNTIESYAEKNRKFLRGESQITADYKRIARDQYEIVCKVTERNLLLMELKLNVHDNNQAKIICKNWRIKAPEVFEAILNRLI